VLLEWRDRPDRATRRDARYRREALLAVKLDHLFAGPLAAERDVGVWGAGPWGKLWARRLGERGRTVAFFVDVDPRKIGRTVHGAPVVGVDALPPPGAAVVLVAVGVDGARDLIRAELGARGWSESRDFFCVQ
jgi:phosphoglycerate dehydrogenase-like enzyme